MKFRPLALISSALTGLVVAGITAMAAPPGVINSYVAVCNPFFAAQCIKVDSNGAVPITGTISASSSERSTAAAPTYVEGTDNPLSGDLSGALRVTGSFSATTAATATAAAPSYVEGSSDPISQNLTGDLRTIAKQSGTWNINNVTGTVTLPTGAATAAGLTTINTTLGTPFQAGGSIGNTSFAVTNAGTFAVQATLAAETTKVIGTVNQGTSPWVTSGTVTANAGTGTFAVSAASLPLPALAATSTKQSDGSQKTQIVDGSGNVIASTSNNLNVQCANCSGSGASAADEASFTAGTSTFAPSGGFFQTTATSNPLTNGQQGFVQMTAQRAFFSNLRNASGTEVGTSTTPLQVSVANTAANGTAMLVTGTGGTFPTTQSTSPWVVSNGGTFAVQAAQSGTWNITNVSGTVSLPTGASTEASLVKLPLAQASTTSGQSGPLVQGAVTTAAPTYTTAQTSPLSLTTGGLLRVDASGATQPVSGTVTANQGTSPWVVAGGGTAGSAASGVVTVQGIASMTKLLVTPDSVALPANQSVNVSQINAVTPLMGNGVTGTGSQRVTIASDNTAFSVNATLAAETTKVIGTVRALGNAGAIFDGVNTAATAPANGVLGLGIYNSTEPSPSTGQSVGVQLDAKGRTRGVIMDAAGNTRGVNVTAGNALLVDGTGGAFPVTATNLSTNLAQVNGVTTLVGNGASGTGAQRVTIASDSTGTIIATQATGSNLHTVLDSGTLTTLTTLTGTTTLTPGTSATNLGKAEDAAAGSGDTGVGSLFLQQAAPADNANDGDYAVPQISGGFQWVAARPTVTTVSTTVTRPADTNAYAANDNFSNSTSAPTAGGFTLTSACRVSGGYGTLTDVEISASAGTGYQGELWIFDQAVTAVNDNAAFTVSDSDVQNLVGVVPFQTTDITAANAISYVTGLNFGYTCVGTANLRFLIKIMAAVTPASAEMLAVRAKVNN